MKVAYMNQTSNYLDFELSAQIRNGVLPKKLVENFYLNCCDNTTEIQSLLNELNINSIEELL